MAKSSKQTLTCACQQVTLTCHGKPEHLFSTTCFENWRRTGNLSGLSAVFNCDAVTIQGHTVSFSRIMPDGESCHYQFCPSCSTTVLWQTPLYVGQVIIPSGLFPPQSYALDDAQSIAIANDAFTPSSGQIGASEPAIKRVSLNEQSVKYLH